MEEDCSMPNLTLQVQPIESTNVDVNKTDDMSKEKYSDVTRQRNDKIQSITENKEAEEPWTEVLSKKKNKTDRKKKEILVGSSQTPSELVGVKKAWLHLGKLQEGTTTEQVENFLQKRFPEMSLTVSKLESKGKNCSFRLGVDYNFKDALLNSDAWPRNVTLRRFLFPRRVAVLPP